MDAAEELLDKISSLVKLQKKGAEKFYKLAAELEEKKKSTNVTKVVGSSVSVGGAAAAGVLALCTGGLALPFLAAAGTVASVAGLATNVGSDIKDITVARSIIKEAEEVSEKIKCLEKRIQELMETLAEEGKRRVGQDGGDDSAEDYVMEQIMRAMAKREGLKLNDHISLIMKSEKIKTRISGLNIGFNVLSGAVCGGLLGLIAGSAIGIVTESAKTTGKKAATSAATKAAAGCVGGAALGVGLSVPELFINLKNLEKCETEVSKTLRENAKAMRTASEEKDQMLQVIRMMLEEMVQKQEEEERQRQIEEERQRQKEEERQRQERQQLLQRCMVVTGALVFAFLAYCVFTGGDSSINKERNYVTDQILPGLENVGEDQVNGKNQVQTYQKQEERQGDQTDRGRRNQERQSYHSEETGHGQQRQQRQQRQQGQQGQQEQGQQSAVAMVLSNFRSINEIKLARTLKNNLSLICATETWTKKDNADKVLRDALPENFNVHHQSRDGRGGGVAIMFSDVLHGEQIFFNFITTFEYVATVLQHEDWDRPVLYICLYNPPWQNLTRLDKILEEFEELLKVADNYSSVIIAGDFNIHTDKERKTSTRKFKTLLKKYNFSLKVKDATHKKGRTLDQVITKGIGILGVSIINNNISDHYSVYVDVQPKDEEKKNEENMDPDETVKRVKKSG